MPNKNVFSGKEQKGALNLVWMESATSKLMIKF